MQTNSMFRYLLFLVEIELNLNVLLLLFFDVHQASIPYCWWFDTGVLLNLYRVVG